jgi:hypothetical protein
VAAPRPPDGLYDGDTVAVWLEPPGFVYTQVRSSYYTVAQAQTFIEAIMGAARARLGFEHFVWISDSRKLETYEPGARKILVDWAIASRGTLDRIVLIAEKKHSFVWMGMQFASVAAALAGIPITIESSPRALSRLKIPDVIGP